MNTRAMLRFALDAVAECENGNITPAQLAPILDFLGANIRRVRALPGQDNVPLRTVGARMDGWLHSIHDPEAVRSRPLLLLRLRQIAEAAEEVAALEDARDCAIPARPANVIAFPLVRAAAPRAELPL